LLSMAKSSTLEMEFATICLDAHLSVRTKKSPFNQLFVG
jgi:hypothetical protein